MQCAATRTSLLRTTLGVYAVTYRAYRALFCARSGKRPRGRKSVRESFHFPSSVPQGRLNFRPVQIKFEKRLGSATTLYGTVALSFVIPSSRLTEASRERNDKACALCNIEG